MSCWCEESKGSALVRGYKMLPSEKALTHTSLDQMYTFKLELWRILIGFHEAKHIQSPIESTMILWGMLTQSISGRMKTVTVLCYPFHWKETTSNLFESVLGLWLTLTNRMRQNWLPSLVKRNLATSVGLLEPWLWESQCCVRSPMILTHFHVVNKLN